MEVGTAIVSTGMTLESSRTKMIRIRLSKSERHRKCSSAMVQKQPLLNNSTKLEHSNRGKRQLSSSKTMTLLKTKWAALMLSSRTFYRLKNTTKMTILGSMTSLKRTVLSLKES